MDTVRNKLSSCFNPIIAENQPRSHSPPPCDAGESLRRKKPAHYCLSGFVKAVFFRTSLLKKLRSKRLKKPTKKKKTQISRNKPISDPQENLIPNHPSDRSSLFSSSSSSSIASSISSNTSLGSDPIKLSPTNFPDLPTRSFRQHAMKLVSKSSKCDRRGLMLIVLVCLVALVFWGKVFAIVTCTSAWLFLAPGRVGPRGGCIRGSEEHNKMVIMEGLLQRDNVIRSRIVPLESKVF